MLGGRQSYVKTALTVALKKKKKKYDINRANNLVQLSDSEKLCTQRIHSLNKGPNLSTATMCGGSLLVFQTWTTRTAKKCARILILESGQYNLRECPIVEAPDSVKTQ